MTRSAATSRQGSPRLRGEHTRGDAWRNSPGGSPPIEAGTTCTPERFSRVNPLVGGKTVALSEAEGTPISAGLYSPFARTDATSYSAMPVATAAFKDSTADEIGIETI